MKTMQLSILMLFLISISFPLGAFAQDYTQWGLPEGADNETGKRRDIRQYRLFTR